MVKNFLKKFEVLTEISKTFLSNNDSNRLFNVQIVFTFVLPYEKFVNNSGCIFRKVWTTVTSYRLHRWTIWKIFGRILNFPNKAHCSRKWEKLHFRPKFHGKIFGKHTFLQVNILYLFFSIIVLILKKKLLLSWLK